MSSKVISALNKIGALKANEGLVYVVGDDGSFQLCGINDANQINIEVNLSDEAKAHYTESANGLPGAICTLSKEKLKMLVKLKELDETVSSLVLEGDFKPAGKCSEFAFVKSGVSEATYFHEVAVGAPMYEEIDVTETFLDVLVDSVDISARCSFVQKWGNTTWLTDRYGWVTTNGHVLGAWQEDNTKRFQSLCVDKESEPFYFPSWLSKLAEGKSFCAMSIGVSGPEYVPTSYCLFGYLEGRILKAYWRREDYYNAPKVDRIVSPLFEGLSSSIGIELPQLTKKLYSLIANGKQEGRVLIHGDGFDIKLSLLVQDSEVVHQETIHDVHTLRPFVLILDGKYFAMMAAYPASAGYRLNLFDDDERTDLTLEKPLLLTNGTPKFFIAMPMHDLTDFMKSVIED